MNSPAKDENGFFATQARHVRQCLKEAWFVGIAWLLTLIYIAFVVYRYGYISPDQRPEVPPLVFGIPAWAFWGVVAPWIAMVGVAWFFALFVMKDDEPFQQFPLQKEAQESMESE
jgi:hypothetical protein